MNHINFLFYILGAIQLGNLVDITVKGNKTYAKDFLQKKIELVNSTPYKVDPENGIPVHDHEAYKLFVILEWLFTNSKFDGCSDSIERDILRIIDSKSVYSFGECSILYYFLGAIQLCDASQIEVTRAKILNLTKLDKTDLYKNVMFIFEANGTFNLDDKTIRNISPVIVKQISVIEAQVQHSIAEAKLETKYDFKLAFANEC